MRLGDEVDSQMRRWIEQVDSLGIQEAVHQPLDGNSPHAADFLKGGYKQDGYGVASGAAIDGNFAIGKEGHQGYFVDETEIKYPDGRPKSGKRVFVDTVEAMKHFFDKREEKMDVQSIR